MVVSILGLLTSLAVADAPAAKDAAAPQVEVGKPAPEFALKDESGKEVKLSGFKGKKAVLLAFYPKDFTGG